MIPVVWWNANPDAIARGYWDQALIEDVLARGGFEHMRPPETLYPGEVTGAVVVVPARHNVEHVDALNTWIAGLDWVLLILTGDEEHVFPHEKISHPRRKVWAMGVFPGAPGVDRPLGSGYSPGFRDALADVRLRAPGRLDVVLVAQDTHVRRHQAFAAARAAAPGDRRLVRETMRFLANGTEGDGGCDRTVYASLMADTKVAPCPSGPESPDSFRLYEALEAGAVPVADGSTPHGRVDGYWPYVFGEPVPFPVLDNWNELAEHVENVRRDWPRPASRISAWWQLWKRKLAHALADDLQELSGVEPTYPTPDDAITVIIPTCPIECHPDTTMIETVVESVRAQLPRAEIIIVCDGMRPKMEHKTADYEQFLFRLTRLCAGWTNVVPLIRDEWGHQANSTRAALDMVRTPLILFVEHDTPIVGEIDWPGLCYVVDQGIVNMVRLHHETQIGDYHRHMMLDPTEQLYGTTDEHPGVPLMRTFQWSQRPHLATTKFYRERVMPYFGKESRTYIEWIMHGAVQHGIERGVERTWNDWRVAIYHPPGGNMQRSTHLDGRAGSSLEDAVWAYDGPPPPGAPPASA